MSDHNISLKKYKRIAKWLNSLSEDELAFIDSFIEEIEFELEEMVLDHCDYKESFDLIQRIRNDQSSSGKKR
jgi:phosphoribosylformylglycinamidine (FGAM) synthase-like enzyme